MMTLRDSFCYHHSLLRHFTVAAMRAGRRRCSIVVGCCVLFCCLGKRARRYLFANSVAQRGDRGGVELRRRS